MIGIISTFEQEFAAIIEGLKGISADQHGSQNFHIGQVNSHPFVLAASGPGKVAAAATTQQLIDQFEPETVILIGIVPKFVAFLNDHDLVLANAIFQCDINPEQFGRTDEEAEPATRLYIPDVELSRQLAGFYDTAVFNKALDRKLVHGTLLSGDSITEDPTKQRALIRQHGVVAIDQEAGALAQVCQKNEVPFAIARMISKSRVLTDETTMYVAHKEASEAYLKLLNALLSEQVETETTQV